MKLPVIDLPIYETVLPSTGEKVKYRAFSVKEEKIMLIAKEASDTEQIILSIKQVLSNCLIDKDIETLAVFDIEYIFAMIRGKSVNNVVDFTIRDPDTAEDVKLTLKIDDITIKKDERHSNKIRINDDYVLFMKYPNYDAFVKTFRPEIINDPLAYYDVMISCLDKLVSNDTVYEFQNFEKKEVDEFLENLGNDVVEKIQLFFETMPKLRHEIKYVNKNGDDKVFVIEGTESFFM